MTNLLVPLILAAASSCYDVDQDIEWYVKNDRDICERIDTTPEEQSSLYAGRTGKSLLLTSTGLNSVTMTFPNSLDYVIFYTSRRVCENIVEI